MAGTQPITVVITCSVCFDKLETARRELEAVITTVMANEPACRGIQVHEDPQSPERWLIIERWESEETFRGPHMQTPHMQRFIEKAEAFLDGEPQFTFWRAILAA